MNEKIYKIAVEKFEMAKQNPNVEFTIDEVSSLLEISDKQVLVESGLDVFHHNDIMMFVDSYVEGKGRSINELSVEECEKVMVKFVSGIRNANGEFKGFNDIDVIAKEFNLNVRSFVKFALTKGWHQRRLSYSMQLAGYHHELVRAEIEQRKPLLALKRFNFTEKVIDNAISAFDTADINEQSKIVSMVTKIMKLFDGTNKATEEQVDKMQEMLGTIGQQIEANHRKNQEDGGQTEGEFVVV